MQLEAEISYTLREFELDEVMNILSGRVIAHKFLARVRPKIDGDRIQRCAELRSFTFGQDPSCKEGRRMRLARGNLLVEKPPIEDDRPLPRFKVGVERLAKAA